MSPEALARKRARGKRNAQARRDRLFRCGHPRSPENTATRPDRRPFCLTCQRAASRDAQARRLVRQRGKRTPLRWISSMTPVQFQEAHAAYNRWLAEQSGTSRDSTDTAQRTLNFGDD